MPNPADILPPEPDPTPEANGLLRGEVLTVEPTLRVIVPSLSGKVVEIERWQGETPRVGDEILVGHDDEGNEWLAGLATPPAGMRVGTDADYLPPDIRDFILGPGIYPGGGSSPPRQGASIGGIYFSAKQMRGLVAAGWTVVEAGDPPELGFVRVPAPNTRWPTGGGRVFRKFPPGPSTIVGADSSGNELWLRRVDNFVVAYDGSESPFEVAGQALTWTGRGEATALLVGSPQVGDTEIVVAESPSNALPNEGWPAIAHRQGFHYTSKSLALDGQADGAYMAGATAFVVRNVTAEEWANVDPDGGYLKIVSVNATRRWKYESATYNAATEKATFTFAGKFDENVADGAAVTLHKLSGITSEFEAPTRSARLIGSQTLEIDLVHPDTGELVDPELVAMIPETGELWTETHVVDGTSHDFPVERLEYTSRTIEREAVRFTLAEPLEADIPRFPTMWVVIAGCPGILRDDLKTGQAVQLSKFTGVAGLTGTVEAGTVAEYNPRRGSPSVKGGDGFLRWSMWRGTQGVTSPYALITAKTLDDAIGSKRAAAIIQTIGRTIGGRVQKTFTTPDGFGVGMANESLVDYPIHAWDFSCRAQAPGFEVEQPDDPDEDPDDPGEPDEGGYILTGTLYVNQTVTPPAKTSGRLVATIYDRINGVNVPDAELDYTGKGAEGITFTGLATAGSIAGRPLSDFYVKGGTRFRYADSVKSVSAAFDTNGLFGEGREYEVEVGNIGPAGEAGIRLGLTDPRSIYKTDTGIEVDGAAVATEDYADLLAEGTKWKPTCRVATTANISLQNLQTVDGVSLAANDRVLVKDQTDQTENGIYLCKAGTAWTRATDADTGTELEAAVTDVSEGTVHGFSSWRQVSTSITLGSTAIQWTERPGLTNAGAGLTRTGSRVDVGAGNGITVNADDVALASTAAGAGLTYTTGVLAVGAGSGIDVAADSVAVDPQDFNLTGTHANRPAAGTAGRTYFETDTHVLYLDTGAAWVAISPGYVSKTADETVNNSNTLQNDDHLFWPVEAGEQWAFDGLLRCTGNSGNADWKFGWAGTATYSMSWGVIGDTADFSPGAIDAEAVGVTPATQLGQTSTLSVAGKAAPILVAIRGTLSASVAGTVQFQWAQNTATAESSALNTRSYFRLTRLV